MAECTVGGEELGHQFFWFVFFFVRFLSSSWFSLPVVCCRSCRSTFFTFCAFGGRVVLTSKYMLSSSFARLRQQFASSPFFILVCRLNRWTGSHKVVGIRLENATMYGTVQYSAVQYCSVLTTPPLTIFTVSSSSSSSSSLLLLLPCHCYRTEQTA